MVQAIAKGTKAFGNQGDAWLDWFLFPAMPDDQVRDVLEFLEIAEGYQGGPGERFQNRPTWKTGARWTLVTVRGGFDV